MSSTTQVTTFSDIYTDILNRTRQDTGASATVTQAKRYANTALMDMHIGFGEKFPWCERAAVIITQPSYSEGTISIFARGSTQFTTSSTFFTSTNDFGHANARAGGKIHAAGESEVYEVSIVVGDSQLTLLSQHVADDSTPGDSYTYFEDEAALATDFLRPIDYRRFTSGPNPIELIGRSEFYRRFGQNYTLGRPRYATLIDKAFSASTTPVRKVVFHPAPDQAYQIHYRYVTSYLAVATDGSTLTQMSSDTDEPIVPVRYRHAIVMHALYHWYRDKKDDTRSGEAKNEYIELVSRIAGDTEIGTQPARITPRVSAYTSRARRPYGGGRRLGRYDVNGAFDRMEDV